MRLALLVLALALPGTAHADLRFAIDNDAFTSVVPPLDDNGFTNDIALSFYRPRGDYVIGGALFDRWITEVRGPRRWDHLDVTATIERTWGTLHERSLTVGTWLGPSFSGNFGGRWMQNGWHTLTGTGPTLAEGLQSRYDGDRKAAVIAGARVRGSIGSPNVQAYAVASGQLAAGTTGVTRFETAGGGRAITYAGKTQLGLHAELALTRYHVGDPNLALPGGYGVGFQFEWRAGVHVEWSRYRVEYEYRANEGGSHEPIGVLAFTVGQYAWRR